MNEKDKIKYVVAFTYGDGYLGKHGKYCRFEAPCIIDNIDYIEWRKSILENITPVNIYINKDKRDNRRTIIKTCTRTHPLFSRIQSRIYHSGRKTVDPHYLKLFDWETLAIFYMDDGSLQTVKQNYKDSHYKNSYPNIASMSFNYAENLMLKKAIKDNLEIEFNIRKHSIRKDGTINYMLYLAGSSRERFYKNISKYVLPSFKYKLEHSYERLLPEREDGEIVRTME